MRRDIVIADRPHGSADHDTRLEVDRVIGKAAPAPEIGGAAQTPCDRDAHIVMAGRIDDMGVRERLRLGLSRQPTRLEHEHGAAEPLKFEGERDADRPRADDADIVTVLAKAFERVADHAVASTRCAAGRRSSAS